jgi:hypothetical protein
MKATSSAMDFDEMLETWSDRDALRQALQTEEARVRGELRPRRGTFWFLSIFGTGMAIWAGLWIAITITNGWSAIYAIGAGVSSGMFALGVGALWVSRGSAEPERNPGNTLQEDVRRSLALVDYQLSLTRHWISYMLGAASIAVGTGPFSWTITRSQDIPDSSLLGYSGWWWYTGLLVAFFVWASYKTRNEMRKGKAKLETRQRRLRELLAALDA